MRWRRRGTAVVFGNCQARAVAGLLDRTPAFARRYSASAFEVHTIGADQVDAVRATFAAADLVITQAVGDDYHGLPVGSEQLLAACRPGVRVVRIPKLYSTAPFPFQIYYNGPTDVVRGAIHYGDLRAVARASGVEQAADPEGIHTLAAASDADIAAVEAATDVRVWAWASAPGRRGEAMWSVDHPRRAVLDRIAAGVLDVLGLRGAPPGDGEEILGDYRAPVEPEVVAALGWDDVTPSTTWHSRRHGRFESAAVVAADAAMLASRPEVLATVHHWQADRLAALWPRHFAPAVSPA